MLRILFSLLIMTAVYTSEFIEVGALDQSLIGTWRILATSEDKGQKIASCDFILGRMYQSRFVGINGISLHINKILKTKNNEDNTVYILSFSDDENLMWAINMNTNGVYLVQVFSVTPSQETSRLVMKVAR